MDFLKGLFKPLVLRVVSLDPSHRFETDKRFQSGRRDGLSCELIKGPL
jgi:hypothetical protein